MRQVWAEQVRKAHLAERAAEALEKAQQCLAKSEDAMTIQPPTDGVTQRAIAWANISQGYSDIARTYAHLPGTVSLRLQNPIEDHV